MNCVQARVQMQHVSGVFAENVFYNATIGAPTMTDLEELAELWHDWTEEALRTIITNDWQITAVPLRAMNEAEGIQLNDPTGYPKTGTNGGTEAPLQVSYTVTWSTGLVGRSARGRTYGLGLSVDQILSATRLSDEAQALFQAKWYGLLSAMQTGGHAIQVVSFVDAGVPRAAGRMLPALAVNVRFPLATQRRRLS